MAIMVSLYPLRRGNITIPTHADSYKFYSLNQSLMESSVKFQLSEDNCKLTIYRFFEQEHSCLVLAVQRSINLERIKSYAQIEQISTDSKAFAFQYVQQDPAMPDNIDWHLDKEGTQHIFICDPHEWQSSNSKILLGNYNYSKIDELSYTILNHDGMELELLSTPTSQVFLGTPLYKSKYSSPTHPPSQKPESFEKSTNVWNTFSRCTDLIVLHKAYQMWIRKSMDELNLLLKRSGTHPTAKMMQEFQEFRAKILHFQAQYYFKNPVKRNRKIYYDFSKWLHKHMEHDEYNDEFLRQMSAVVTHLQEHQDRQRSNRFALVGLGLALIGGVSIFGAKFEDVDKWFRGWMGHPWIALLLLSFWLSMGWTLNRKIRT